MNVPSTDWPSVTGPRSSYDTAGLPVNHTVILPSASTKQLLLSR